MRERPSWWRLVGSGLLAGLLINICEWAVHHGWLDRAWAAAFATLGKEPTGWTAFIPANFWLGILAVLGYRWLSGLYGSSLRTALRTAVGVWLVFWVIPTAALAPLALFPSKLLLSVVLVGLADGVAATLLGAWLYDGKQWRRKRLAPSGA